MTRLTLALLFCFSATAHAQVALPPTIPPTIVCSGLPQTCVDPLTGATIAPAPQPSLYAPSVEDRVNQALMLSSVGFSSIALGLTMTCTTDGTCRELNPVMYKFLGDGPVRAVAVKSAANAGITYAVWRTTRGKTRMVALAALATINALDAIHDIRQMRQIERRRASAR